MILTFFLLPQLFFCQILKELKKYDSLKVIPDTKIYLDVSTFNDYEQVCFEITMDLFFASDQERQEYKFYLEQVSFTTHPSPSYWDKLPQVVATDKEGYDDDITFKYDVVKQPGSTYIYIKTPEPFEDYYNFWEKKIKIKNAGGPGNVLAIVLGIVIPIIIIIIIIIICCVYSRRKRYYANGVQRVIPQAVYVQTNPVQPIYPQQGYIYQNVPQQNNYQPNLPQNNYQYINVQHNNQQQNYPQQNYPQQNNVPDSVYNSHPTKQPNARDSNYTSTPQNPISVRPHPFDEQINSRSDIMRKDNAAPIMYNQ